MTKVNKKPLELKSVSRRKAVKQIVGGVSALAAYNMLPVKWEKPIIEQIFLPAHAAVSGITLSDPCSAELVSGNQESSIDVIRVSGFVTPPVGGLEVTIEGTPNGGSGGPVTVTTSTASDGTYSAEVTMVGGPGIIGVGATTTVAGVNGAAHCSVGIPPADHPSAQRPQQPTVSCSSSPGSSLSAGVNYTLTTTVTVSPNPGTGTLVSNEVFLNGSRVSTNNAALDASGQAFQNFIYTGFVGDNVTIRWEYAGKSCESVFNFISPP